MGVFEMSNLPLWLKQFSWFPVSDMPELGDEWQDMSWGNDACPMFYNAKKKVFLYINPRNRDLWDCPYQDKETRMFIIPASEDETGEVFTCFSAKPLAHGEEFDEIERALADNSLWRKWICDHWVYVLGIGFHPDTKGDDINGLEYCQQKDFDRHMAALFSLSPDPYDDGLAAFKRAKLI
jgi:hypothetical protein